jgi:phosphoribosylanthranilate isomerase
MAKVKICGITNLDDALAAIEFGADALGFVFASSPRQVTNSEVREITAELPPFICKVGVFVNSELDQVRETMSFCNLDLAQLNGTEDPDYCTALFPRAIKVFTADSLPSDQELPLYHVAAFMLDKDKSDSIYDTDIRRLWQIALEIRRHGPVILAGGLTPESVSLAIEMAHPYAVDVSSGVENNPGKKDHEKVRAFITAAKHAIKGGRSDIA